jgi:DNA-binding MarR family transcriptional regulator
MNTQILNLTELEQKVLDVISNGDSYDDKPSQSINNISEELEISTKILRGVLSSLEQKNAIVVGWYPNGLKAFMLQD